MIRMRGKPIFAGTTMTNLIDKILNITGNPTQEDIENLNAPHTSQFFANLNNELVPEDLHEIFPEASEELLDLFSKMIQLDPYKRITAMGIFFINFFLLTFFIKKKKV
jgi:serine/threonine protein kinase